MTDIDLDKLEALAEAALPYWGAVDMALGGNPIAADLVAPFAASVSPATIKSLIASAREAAAEIERLRRIEAIAKMLDAHLGEDDRMWSDDSSISSEWIGSDGVRRSLTFGLFRQLRATLSPRAAQMDGEG